MRILLIAALFSCSTTALAADPLPSWNDGDTKAAILDFVEAVTTEGGPGFVPIAERIATFDNDGCLWAEQPAYFQLAFSIDRVKALADDHPEWKTTEPFKSVLADDLKAVAGQGMKAVAQIAMVAHADMTADEFEASARDWLNTAVHPKLGRRYVDCVYQPQLELLSYLRANGFKTFIVSGGGIDFLRVFAEEAYGIPPEQVVGTSIKATYELRDGVPVIIKQPELDFVDDKAGKPVGIYQHIGRRPLLACGNSDGDLQMLQYTTIPRNEEDDTPRLGILLHHTDADREFAYDRESSVGRLDVALDEASSRGWIVIDMAQDWATIFPE
ncbi:haloacid dehalogenase-like hydrolase [Botrimarina colliarenosi]|uniref:Haloacid dehalogenase-like hydrolase n=1 Tax=Botrimarina colliarenosi TaxID=2528001 RepID=A0A5C6ACG8_9BACT|nr:HAD family hydrolase [Botrimarina colliarenosi]TWT97742.1 haloacid dehalogenase-like hydrolase [Botrimarina colliarenosi]